MLPALPQEWQDGSLRGLKVRGAAGMDIAWKAGRLAQALLHSERGGKYNVALGDQVLEVELKAGQSARLILRDGKLVEA